MNQPKFKIGDMVKPKNGNPFRVVGIRQFEGMETSYWGSPCEELYAECYLEIVKPKKTITLYRHTYLFGAGDYRQSSWQSLNATVGTVVHTESKTLEIEE